MATPAAVLSILVQAKGIHKVSSELEKLNAQAKRSADATTALEKRFSRLDSTVGDFNRSMTGARNVVALVKFPALIAGAGAAAQAVGALAGGAVALTSALAPVSGAGLAGAAGLVAMAQAAGTAKLATLGLEDAIKGQKGAMDKLSPIQRQFVKDIRALKGETRDLRGDAQRGLLPGLDKALKTITPLFSQLRPIVSDTAKVMGGLAVAGARVVRMWGSDLQTAGATNVKVIRNLGRAAIIAADGAKDLVVVAGPLLTWFSKLAVTGAQWVRSQTQAGRESGKLAGFLEKTRAVMSTLGHIIANLAAGFYEIGKAAAPLGRQILGDIEKLTERFKNWTQSFTGRATLAQYFRDAKGPVYEVFGLVGDLGGALLRLSKPGPESSGLIAKMRELVPVLENVIASTTAAFGPVLIDALGNVLRLFGQLAGTSGPLNATVQLIGLLAGAMADLLSSSPALNTFAVTTIGLASSFKVLALVFGPLVAGVKALTIATGLSTAATATQTSVLGLSVVATEGATVATVALGLAMRALPWVALAAGIYLAYTRITPFRKAVQDTFQWIKQHWPLLLGIITGPIGLAVLAIAKNWDKIRDKTTSVWQAIKTAITKPIRAAVDAVKDAIGSLADWLSGKWDGIVGTARGFVNAIIDVLNVLPFVNIKHVGAGVGDTTKNAAGGKSKFGPNFATGGKITAPVAIMGEEAPTHPEWVIPTNPAYRKRAIGLWMNTAHDIGIPGFALGGKITGALGGAASSIVGKLPGNPFPDPVKGVGRYVLDKARDFIGDKAKSIASAVTAPFRGGATIHGLLPRVLRALEWARSHGWHGSVTSGYRSHASQQYLWDHAAQLGLIRGISVARPGTSSHEMGAAVDVTDIPGFRKAMASAPADSRLLWRGPSDPVHFSITGHRKGGLMKFAQGGMFSAAALAGLAGQAGFSKASIPLAVAIALAESGGRANASNRNSDGSIDRGLWQINSSHGGLSTFNPLANARAAYSISKHGRNWNPWTVYRTGAYKKFLGTAKKAAAKAKKKIPNLKKSGGAGSVGPAPLPEFTSSPTPFQIAADAQTALQGADMEAVQHAISTVQGHLAAGDITPEQANVQTGSILTSAIGGGFGALSEDDILELRGELNQNSQTMQDLIDATQRLADEQAALKDEIKRQNDFSTSVANVTSFQAIRALADVINGQIGGYTSNRATTASWGSTVRL